MTGDSWARAKAWATDHRPPDAAVDIALGLFLVGWPPIQRVAANHQGYGIRAVSVAVVVLAACIVLVVALADRRADLRATAAVVVAMGVVGTIPGGRQVGAWLLVTGMFGAWVGMRRILPIVGAYPRRAILPVAIAVFMSGRAARGYARFGTALAWFAIALALALILRWRPDLPKRLGHILGRIVHVTVTLILLVPLWFVTALLPWIFQRLTRFDPLEPRGAGRSGWVSRSSAPVESNRLWFRDPARDRLSLGRRLHACAPFGLALMTVLVVIAGIVWVQVIEPLVDPPADSQAKAILLDAPGAEALRKANDEAISQIWFSQWVGNEWSNYASEHVNITNGRRKTWRPEACRDDQLRVWVFGGSTTFGVYQRDDFTIPSELAKQADERGLALHVENWGMPGDVAWQQVRRLERALISGERPDAVVFYDGWNDLRAVQDLDFAGREGLEDDLIGPLDRLQERALRDLAGAEPGGRYLVDVPEVEGTPSPEEAVEIAGASYAHAHDMAELITTDEELPFVHVYQPSLLTRSTEVTGEPPVDPPRREPVESFRDELPEGVVDLGGALDDVEEPVFYDETHTTEAGSRFIAAALLDELWPTLEAVADEQEVGRCP